MKKSEFINNLNDIINEINMQRFANGREWKPYIINRLRTLKNKVTPFCIKCHKNKISPQHHHFCNKCWTKEQFKRGNLTGKKIGYKPKNTQY